MERRWKNVKVVMQKNKALGKWKQVMAEKTKEGEMKKIIILSCALYLVLAFGTAYAAPPNKVGLEDIPPAWSKTLQCDARACPRFELVMGGAAVLDHETGLVWEQAPNAQQLWWIDAVNACADKKVGNRMGWHLPTFEQLASLVDPTIASPGPTLPTGHPFTNISLGDAYHSSTTYTDPNIPATWANGVHFRYALRVGTSTDPNQGGMGHVWCVRGEQSRDSH